MLIAWLSPPSRPGDTQIFSEKGWINILVYVNHIESYGLCHSYPSMSLCHECSHGEYINYEHGGASIKLYLQIRRDAEFSCVLVSFLDPCFRPPAGSSFGLLDSCGVIPPGPQAVPKIGHVP